MKIQESGEMYLETILVLKKEKGNVRSIDIANKLNVSRPSVSRAMKQFRDNEYITIDDNGLIDFTDKGFEIAITVYEKHTILTKFLKSFGIEDPYASDDACKIEHILSDESFDKIKAYTIKLK